MTNYGTIYTLPFQSIKGVDYIVEIQKENYTGRSIELKGSGDAPFSVELADEDFLYTPSRFSVATIRVIGNDYLQSLYSTGYQQYRVNFKRGTTVVWTGFVTPELYTQDYTSTLFDLEIQCVSAMSTLEYIKYKEVGEKRAFVSLWDLIKKCVLESRGLYSSVYIPHVYAKSASLYNTSENVLQAMTVSEQDFFDEDDEPMTLKEVLEEICKLLGWTCVDYRGELFFVDVDHKGLYKKYSADLSDYEAVTPGALKVQDVGFSGSDHTLDILGGYNKAVVRVSNYPVGDMLPDEKHDDMKELNTMDDENSDHKVCRRVFLIPNNWKTLLYENGREILPNELQQYKDTAHTLEGSIPMKYCTYEQEKDMNGKWQPKITDYAFNNVLQVRYPKANYSGGALATCRVMSISGASAVYSSGAFCINGSFKRIKTEDAIPWGNSTTVGGVYAQIRVGNMYYGTYRADNDTKYQWGEDSKLLIRLRTEWVDSPQDYVSMENQKTLSMPYTGASGIIIPISGIVLNGDFEFSLMAPVDTSGDTLLIKDFRISYYKDDRVTDDSENNSDRYYENVVNESYVNPADEIEFKISSYNNDGACYSKVMLGDNYLTDNLYSAIENKPIRPEEGLIRRIVNQYSATKNKLTQVLTYSDSVTPITAITDKFQPGKQFVVTGGEIDFAADSFTVKMVQNGN